MVSRGNVNTARITRYRSYEAVIGEGEEEEEGVLRHDQLIFYFIFFNTDTSSLRKILTHLHPE